MKILLLAASVRENSCNKKLIDLIAKLSGQQKIETQKLDFADFLAPLYDGNFEEKFGLPETAKAFIAKLQSADGLIIATPEYNFSTPGTLKNLIDWTSRVRPMPWLKYPIMLCSASPSLVGGHRGLLHTATTLQFCCNANVFPALLPLGNAYEAFAADGSLKDKKIEQKLIKNIVEFIEYVRVLKQSNP